MRTVFVDFEHVLDGTYVHLQVRMPSIKARVLDDIRRQHLRQLTPELLASMERAGVADEVISPNALKGLHYSAHFD